MSDLRSALKAQMWLPIGIYVEVDGGSGTVKGQVFAYKKDQYVVLLGSNTRKTLAPEKVLLHRCYDTETELSDKQLLIQILARRLPVDLYVEVFDGSAHYYGQITGYAECNYCVRVGGTSSINEVSPDCVSPHPTFRAINVDWQRRRFDRLTRIPVTGTIEPEERLGRLVSTNLESLLSGGTLRFGVNKRKRSDPAIMGVGLFKIEPKTGNLSVWQREGNKEIHNGAMTGVYPSNDLPALANAKALVTSLLERAKILRYFSRIASDLTGYNVVAHLHYYRNRTVPDPGFHKDTRGQTLFFMLQYINDKPIFGPEWVEDSGLAKLQQPSFISVISGGKEYLKCVGKEVFWENGDSGWKEVKLDKWEEVVRVSPADGRGVWPETIRDAIKREKAKQNDPKIHVARIPPHGAVLVVDDLVHHRSPNKKSRSDWGQMPNTKYPQSTTVQAFNALQKNAPYHVDLRTRARSLSNSKQSLEAWRKWREAQRVQDLVEETITTVKEPKKEEGLAARWDNTFSGERRKFFRLWVTVSARRHEVWY